jgi:hypothetical protein
VRFPAHLPTAGADEEVQVGAGVGLQDVVDVKPFPAASGAGEAGDGGLVGGPAGEFVGGYVEVDAPGLDVEGD